MSMYEHTKKLFTMMSIFAVASLGLARTVFADDSSPVSQVFRGAKDALDSLVNAKDQGNVNDVALRINAMQQVFDLSTAEAKDLELKLLTVNKNPDYSAWVSSSTDRLAAALVYFDSERQLVSGSSSLDLPGVKAIAEDFKSWRDAEYTPLVNQVQDFLLVRQESSAIEISQKRLSNIRKDLSSLTFKPGDQKTISGMLAGASNDVKAAKDLNTQAYNLFLSKYVGGATSSASTSTVATSATSAADNVSSFVVPSSTATASLSLPAQAGLAQATTSSSTDAGGAAGTSSPASIKDLVNASLAKIKDAYQNFIDISNLVRKLLQQ